MSLLAAQGGSASARIPGFVSLLLTVVLSTVVLTSERGRWLARAVVAFGGGAVSLLALLLAAQPGSAKGPLAAWLPQSVVGQPIHANAIAVVGALAVVGGFAVASSSALSPSLRRAYLTVALVAGGVVSVAGSRAALAGIAEGLMTNILFRRLGSPVARAIAVVVSVSVVGIIGFTLFRGVGTVEARETMWLDVIARVSSDPFQAGTFGSYANGNVFSGTPWFDTNTHSAYFEALFDFGPIGFAAILGLLAVSLARATRASRTSDVPLWGTTLIVALMVNGLAESVVVCTWPYAPFTTFVSPALFVASSAIFASSTRQPPNRRTSTSNS